MDAKYYGLIEMVMMFAIVGGFTAWTFWSLRDKPGNGPPPGRAEKGRSGEAPVADENVRKEIDG
jgi:hypothetical protein